MESEHQQAIHEAIQGTEPNGLLIHWVLVAEVADPNGDHRLIHRGGGGHDGSDPPMAWTALGMFDSAVQVTRRMVLDSTGPPRDDGDD